MAACSFVLNNVLCFIVAKYGNTVAKYLKSAVLDFYDTDELNAAKRLLLQDVNDIKQDINLPHIPERREGENRAARIVDDIFTILTHLDENLKLKSIPKYVSDGPDKMPSTRLYDGDLCAIMKRLDKVESCVAEFSAKIAAVLTSIQGSHAPTVKPVAAVSAPVGHDVTAGNSKSVSVDMGNQSSATDWATIASTPHSRGNRFAALAIDDTDGDSADTEPFTVVQGRRSAKRARQRSSPSMVPRPPPQQQQQQRAPRRAPTLIGKATNIRGSNLTAAMKIRQKAVFCLDNINANCSVNDIQSYVSNLSITVISCFEVHTRRRRDDTIASVSERKAFRLCIYDDDRDKLLNVNAWPESVTVSQWYFKGVNSTDKRPRPSISGDDADTASRRSISVKASRKDNLDDVNGDAAAAVAAAPTVPPAVTVQNDNAASMLQDETMMSTSDDTILAAYDINDGN